MMHLEIVETKSEDLYILEGFQKSLIPYLNVYNQLYFTLNKPISLVKKFKKETSHEFGFLFPIEGEIMGKAIILIDTFDKELSTAQKESFSCAIEEGLNILIGRTLGSLDENTNLMSMLAPAQKIEFKDSFSLKEKYKLKFNLTYNIEFDNIMYNSRVYFFINKRSFLQVVV